MEKEKNKSLLARNYQLAAELERTKDENQRLRQEINELQVRDQMRARPGPPSQQQMFMKESGIENMPNASSSLSSRAAHTVFVTTKDKDKYGGNKGNKASSKSKTTNKGEGEGEEEGSGGRGEGERGLQKAKRPVLKAHKDVTKHLSPPPPPLPLPLPLPLPPSALVDEEESLGLDLSLLRFEEYAVGMAGMEPSPSPLVVEGVGSRALERDKVPTKKQRREELTVEQVIAKETKGGGVGTFIKPSIAALSTTGVEAKDSSSSRSVRARGKPISYKEPSVKSKVRKGHVFFPSSTSSEIAPPAALALALKPEFVSQSTSAPYPMLIGEQKKKESGKRKEMVEAPALSLSIPPSPAPDTEPEPESEPEPKPVSVSVPSHPRTPASKHTSKPKAPVGSSHTARVGVTGHPPPPSAGRGRFAMYPNLANTPSTGLFQRLLERLKELPSGGISDIQEGDETDDEKDK